MTIDPLELLRQSDQDLGLSSFERRWWQQARECLAETTRLGRFPTQGEPSGSWLDVQRQRARGKRKEPLTGERRAWLDEHLPGWLETRQSEEHWLTKAQECLAETARLGRFPKRGESSYVWLVTQRDTARSRGAPLNVERRAWLDAHLPGWLETEQDRWWVNAQECLAETARLGRLPKQSEPSGGWLIRQRHKARANQAPLTGGQRAWLDENLPGWLETEQDRWWVNAQECLAETTRLGRFPKRGEPSGSWLDTQRQKARRNKAALTGEQRAWLDENLPGWLETAQDRWLVKAQECLAEAARLGRPPKYNEPLGVWLITQRQKARGKRRESLTGEQRAWLDENLMGWLS